MTTGEEFFATLLTAPRKAEMTRNEDRRQEATEDTKYYRQRRQELDEEDMSWTLYPREGYYEDEEDDTDGL